MLNDFIKEHMWNGRAYVPARLQAALALLERLREFPTLHLDQHKEPNSSGLLSHEKYGNQAHARLNLSIINKNHGRRSSNLGGWGQYLLDWIGQCGFENASPERRLEIIDDAQKALGKIIRSIVEQDPLQVWVRGKTVEAIIRDVLKQAEEKGRTGEVAQYLVGAKLQLRLGRDIPVVGSNKGDRKSYSDPDARTGDFEIANAMLEVAMGLPDDKHLDQIAAALKNADLEVWLLTRQDRVATWRNELEKTDGVDIRRVVVMAVDAFVGQNISELGEFSSKGKHAQLEQLFTLYNERWVARVGNPGIRIFLK